MNSILSKSVFATSLLSIISYSFAGSFAESIHITSKNKYIVKISPFTNKCTISSGIKDGEALLQLGNHINVNLIAKLSPTCYIPTKFKHNYTFITMIEIKHFINNFKWLNLPLRA